MFLQNAEAIFRAARNSRQESSNQTKQPVCLIHTSPHKRHTATVLGTASLLSGMPAKCYFVYSVYAPGGRSRFIKA